MKIPLFILAIAVFGTVASFSAPPEGSPNRGPLPRGPLPKRIPDFSSWRITFQYNLDATKPAHGESVEYGAGPDPDYLPNPIRSITIMRTSPRALVVSTDVKGNKVEQYYNGPDEFVSSSRFRDPIAMVRGPTIPIFLADFRQMEFPDMKWVSPETFKGIQDFNNHRAMVFAHEGMVVWIDQETHMPLVWKKEGETRTFQQLPPPSQILELPPKIRAMAEAMRNARDLIGRPGPRGG